MKAPEVSVIIPTFNAGEFLAPLLERLVVTPFQVIVVDDGSTDQSSSLSRKFTEVVWLEQSNRGPSAARNRGLKHASAPFVSFLDADDEWAPTHPEKAIALLRSSECEVIIGKTQCLTSSSTFFAGPFHTFHLGSALFRREVFATVGPFDEQLRFGEDLDWFLRARERSVRMALFAGTTLHYHLHDKNLIARPRAAKGGMLRALHLSIARRRANPALLTDLPVIQ